MELAECASPTESELGIPGRASHLVSDELLSVLAVIPYLCLSMLLCPHLSCPCRISAELDQGLKALTSFVRSLQLQIMQPERSPFDYIVIKPEEARSRYIRAMWIAKGIELRCFRAWHE